MASISTGTSGATSIGLGGWSRTCLYAMATGVGPENGGWRMITTQLNHERVALMMVGPLERLLAEVTEWAAQTASGEGVSIREGTIRRLVTITLDGAGRRAGIELDVEIEPGDSGAPVLTVDDSIAGLVFATNRNAPTGWAIAASELRPVLGQLATDPLPLAC